MIRTTRASLTTKIAVCLASLACASLIGAAVAAGAAVAVTYQKESIGEYEKQLAAGQIKSVTINKKLRSLRVTLTDGRYVLAKYGKKEEPKFAAALQAKHIPVAILTPTEASSQAVKPPVHHKLRYIAGGLVIVVIVVIGAVLVIRRRRVDE